MCIRVQENNTMRYFQFFFLLFFISACLSSPYIKSHIPNQKVKPEESVNLNISILTTFGTTTEDETIDISLTKHPEWLKSDSLGTEFVWEYFHTFKSNGPSKWVYSDGYYAYVADGRSGLNIFNVTDKNDMNLVSNYFDKDNSILYVIKGDRENRIFLMSKDAFYIIDVEDKSNPKLIYRLIFHWNIVTLNGICHFMTYRKGMVYLTCDELNFDSCVGGVSGVLGVAVLNVSSFDQSKTEAVHCFQVDTGCKPYEIVVKDDYCVVTCSDLENEEICVYLNHGGIDYRIYKNFATNVDSSSIAITNDNYFYITTPTCHRCQTHYGMFIVHFDPVQKVIEEMDYKVDLGANTLVSLHLHNDRYLFIASLNNGKAGLNVFLLDTKDRQNPVNLGDICTIQECSEVTGTPYSITVVGNYIYIAIWNENYEQLTSSYSENDFKSLSLIVLGFGGIVLKGVVPDSSSCKEFEVEITASDESSFWEDSLVTESFSIEVESDCSNHGICNNGSCECVERYSPPNCKNCIPNYFGLDCDVTICNGILSNHTSEGNRSVCNGHGFCSAYNVCNCTNEDYHGKFCELYNHTNHNNDNPKRKNGGSKVKVGWIIFGVSFSLICVLCVIFIIFCILIVFLVIVFGTFCTFCFGGAGFCGFAGGYIFPGEKDDSFRLLFEEGEEDEERRPLLERLDKQGKIIFEGDKNGKGKLFLDLTHISRHNDFKPKWLVFKGEFKDGKKNGKGVEYYPPRETMLHPKFWKEVKKKWEVDGGDQEMLLNEILKFEGTFVDDERDGKGIEYSKQGFRSFQGVWRKGEVVKIEKDFIDLKIVDIQNFKFDVFRDKLGSGSEGDVFQVEFEGAPAALKILKSVDNIKTINQRKSMIRSLGIWSKVHDHPNIVSLYCWSGIDYKNLKSPLGYCMSLCMSSLSDMIQKGMQFDWKTKIRILYEVASSMNYLHQKSVMHRDLKLENILMDETEHPQLCDFEFSRYDELDWKIVASNPTVLGTPGYLAPEVILQKSYTKKCDVYSFGIVCYCVYFDRVFPFEGVDRCDNCNAIINPHEIMFHVARCGLRPDTTIQNTEDFGNKYRWLIDEMMFSCVSKNSVDRLDFDGILALFRKKSREKIIDEDDLLSSAIDYGVGVQPINSQINSNRLITKKKRYNLK